MSPVAVTSPCTPCPSPPSSSTFADVILLPPLPRSSKRPPLVPTADVTPKKEFAFDTMEDALAAFGHGELPVVADDEGREKQGDLIIAASEMSAEKLAWG